jgi:hypothetical protein
VNFGLPAGCRYRLFEAQPAYDLLDFSVDAMGGGDKGSHGNVRRSFEIIAVEASQRQTAAAGSPESNGYAKATSAAVGRRAAPMMPKNERPHPRQAAAHAFLDFTYSRQASAVHFQQCAEFPTLVAALSASSRLLDSKSEAARFTKRNISATIVADVKRFFHQINTDEVFGTHSPPFAYTARGAHS